MYLLNIVTPHKLCGPLSTEAVLSPGGGWSWCCVTPCNCKYSQICFNFNFKIKPFREHQRATRLHSPLYSRLVLCWYCIHDEGSPLHSSWKCWQIWGYCGHIPALWPTMETCHRDKLHPHPPTGDRLPGSDIGIIPDWPPTTHRSTPTQISGLVFLLI